MGLKSKKLAGIFFAGVGFDVVEVKHRIELLKVCVIIFFHHIMDRVGDGGGRSLAIVDLLYMGGDLGWLLGEAFFLGSDQVKFFFDEYPGFLGLVLS